MCKFSKPIVGVILVLCCILYTTATAAQSGNSILDRQSLPITWIQDSTLRTTLDLLAKHLEILPSDKSAIHIPATNAGEAITIVPLVYKSKEGAFLYMYYLHETKHHFFLLVSANPLGRPEVRLWGAGSEEIYISEGGIVLLPTPSADTFRLPGFGKDLSPDQILTCIAAVLGISFDVSSLENLLLSASCSASNTIELVLTALNCLSIPGVGTNLVFATLGCVTGIAKMISCGVLACSSQTCNLSPGHFAYCNLDQCGPCAAGEGDCDGDHECQSGLTCVNNVGANYGWSSGTDVCEGAAPPPSCNLSPGHYDYCRSDRCGPCSAGEGDCDGNSECQSGLTCVNNVGANYGWASGVDVCEGASPPPAGCTSSAIRLGETLNGTWDSFCRSTHRSSAHYARFYSFQLTSTRSIQIDLQSSVDTYLFLLAGAGPNGSVIERDDDGGPGLNSRITRTLSAGTYTIEATTYSSGRTGSFSVSLR